MRTTAHVKNQQKDLISVRKTCHEHNSKDLQNATSGQRKPIVAQHGHFVTVTRWEGSLQPFALSVSMSVCMSVRLPLPLSLSISVSLGLSLSLCLCLSVCLSVFLPVTSLSLVLSSSLSLSPPPPPPLSLSLSEVLSSGSCGFSQSER